MRILVELQAPNPPAAGAGLGATKWPRRRPWGARCAAGARRACNARPADRTQGMYCGYARGGVAFGRVLVPLRSPALGSMIGAMPAAYGDPVVAHPSTGRARPAPLQGRERHADAGTWCVRTARGARRARGGAEGAVLPAGGRYFYKGPPGSTVRERRDRRAAWVESLVAQDGRSCSCSSCVFTLQDNDREFYTQQQTEQQGSK